MEALVTEATPSDFDRPRLVSVDETCQMLGLGRTTVYQLLLSNEIPSVMFGRARRIDVDDIRAFIARRKNLDVSTFR